MTQENLSKIQIKKIKFEYNFELLVNQFIFNNLFKFYIEIIFIDLNQFILEIN